MASSAAFVQQLLQSAPQSGALSLAGQRLSGDAVADLMPMLKSFPRLAELDLADNQLQHIADVAQLAHLHRLVRTHAHADAVAGALVALAHWFAPSCADCRACLLVCMLMLPCRICPGTVHSMRSRALRNWRTPPACATSPSD